MNPSCEDGILNWTTLGGNSELEVSTTVVHTGDTASCRAYDRMDEESPPALTSYDGPAQDVTDVVVPGHSYTVNAWALWEPPPSPDAGSPGDAVDAGDDDASAGSSDAAVDAGMSVDAAVDAGFGPQSVYITAKVTCTQNGVQNVAYDRLAIASPVPEATWMPVPDSTLLMVPTGCSGLDVQLYVEGPDIGLDLYTDEVTLLLFQ